MIREQIGEIIDYRISEKLILDYSAIIEGIREKKLPSELELSQLCEDFIGIISKEDNLLNLKGSFVIVGNINGTISCLNQIMKNFGYPSPKNSIRYLFLGSYCCRGKNNLDTLILLMCFKMLHPNSIYLLRGMYEVASISRLYGLYDDCRAKFSLKIWKAITRTFNFFPLAAVLDDSCFLSHSGVLNNIMTVAEFNSIDYKRQPDFFPDDSGPLVDLLFSEPDPEGIRHNDVAANYYFDNLIFNRFLLLNGLKRLIRSHQPSTNGFKRDFEGRVLTIWSTVCSFQEFKMRASVLHYVSRHEEHIYTFDPTNLDSKFNLEE